jgi:hypothetical protein
MIKFEVEEMFFGSTFQREVIRFTRVAMQIKFLKFQHRSMADIYGHNVPKSEIRRIKYQLIDNFFRSKLWT